MDPLTALGLAGNIIQLVDFGLKVVSKGNQIYRSGDGSSDENHDLEVVANDLLVLQAKLEQSSGNGPSDDRPTEEEVMLWQLSGTANGLAVKLLARLNMVKVQGRFRRWKSLRQALKSVSTQKEIDDLARRLTLLKDELQLQILVSIKERLDRADIRQAQRLDLLDQSSRNILAAFQENGKMPRVGIPSETADSNNVSTATVLNSSGNLHANEGGKLKHQSVQGQPDFQNDEEKGEARAAIMTSLRFTGMDARQEAVEEAHANTFSWIFQDPKTLNQPWDHFGLWLQEGAGIYWVNGKAASGKSTLMKYILPHLITRQQLQGWSGTKKLLCANFFFWNTGTSMQKSQAGVLRSLLYQLCGSMSVDAVKRTFPKLWNNLIQETEKARKEYKVRGRPFYDALPQPKLSWDSWTLSELKLAFEMLMNETNECFRICLFIDGLDEFDGDHAEIATFFKDVARFPHLKICVSSRPLLIFEQEFENFQKLRLQDLTRNDIKIYARDKLSSHSRVSQLSKSNPALLENLVKEILEMSSGVFLWVTLAVKSLLKGFSNSDSMADLQRRLRDLPPELDDLYSLMLHSIQPKFYIEQASRLFQIVYHAKAPITALELSFANDANENLALEAKIERLDHSTIPSRIRDMTIHVKTRCAGLLEVPEIPMQEASRGNLPVIRYLHLTVKEFVEKPEVWSFLLAMTKQTKFDAHLALFRSSVLMMKCLRTEWNTSTCENIETAIYYARCAENSTGQPQMALLDELDRTCQKLGGNHHTNFREPTQWCADMISSNEWDNYPESFLTYAISNDLALYVAAKLGNEAQLVNNKTTRPLLLYAVWYTPVEDHSDMEAPHLQMLAVLLRLGLNPNELFQGSTPWREFLLLILCKIEAYEGIELDSTWLDACRLFLIHGADPTAYINQGNRWASVAEIVSGSFTHLPHQSVEDLKIMVLQKREALENSRQGRSYRKRKYNTERRNEHQFRKHHKGNNKNSGRNY